MSTHFCHYMALGATLYIPATRTDMDQILNQKKQLRIRSIIICTEDAISEEDLVPALANIQSVLTQIRPSPILKFIRPRNLKVFTQLIRMPGIENINGFVLPKVDESNLLSYGEIAAQRLTSFLMPTIETDLAFNRNRLDVFRERLAELANPILCLRIGGNDLLGLLKLKRPKNHTIYDTPLRNVINDIILTFRPAGYELAAPVFEYFNNHKILQQEIVLDMIHGLFTKAAVHPSQVAVIESSYRVCKQDLDLAKIALQEKTTAIFKLNEQMVEPSTHRFWAEDLLQRAKHYGVCCQQL
ncbi:HpcH/HpaI aldolase/citrate lyase family protein [Candidatus Nitrosacidococcus sp. I8]|uniref:HpcH/HpaI aldolase/citrate lyase family protein n=1 Tax=Candidatus Nitrosacidococcus sp. I8 TaxID=2942908 RepID=UPI0022261D4F|nr:HpcH/HpaI aldolase/citrate lyase family protein [Candidatus Nitrosacidococcus sp. I8]